MYQTIAVAALLASSVGSAFAADLPSTKSPPVFVAPVAPFSWSGFTVGVNAGIGIGASKFADPVAMDGVAFTGGVGVGYNWQFANNFVLGGVADISYLGPIGGGSGTGVSNSQGGIFGTVRARLGYAFDHLLVYGTGGFAYASGLAPNSFAGSGILGPGYAQGNLVSGNNVLGGYAVGGGLEYAFNNHWSVFGEYLYAHFEHSSPLYNTNVTLTAYPICIVSAVDVIRVGVNYHFGVDAPPPVVAKY